VTFVGTRRCARCFMLRVGHNRTYTGLCSDGQTVRYYEYRYGVLTVFLAEKSPDTRSYMVHTYVCGRPYE